MFSNVCVRPSSLYVFDASIQCIPLERLSCTKRCGSTYIETHTHIAKNVDSKELAQGEEYSAEVRVNMRVARGIRAKYVHTHEHKDEL